MICSIVVMAVHHFIGLTETWLDECKENLYELPHYVSVTKSRNTKRGGGVSLLIRSHIPFVLRNDLAYFDSEMESVFIEIEKSVFHSNANIIMGVVYRMPDSSVDMFNERLADILNSVQKENKLFYLLGDLNIDLFKHDVHRPNSKFLDTIYSYNVYPLVTKPTRVTASPRGGGGYSLYDGWYICAAVLTPFLTLWVPN